VKKITASYLPVMLLGDLEKFLKRILSAGTLGLQATSLEKLLGRIAL